MENDHDITLLRDAMDRAADGLPPLPDLAPVAVREGRRRRTRSRLAVGTAAFAVVTAGVLGVTVLPRPGADVPGVSTGVGGEAERQAGYQRRMAALLDELLPAKVTDVRPVKGKVSEYRLTAGGETFRMVVSVLPVPLCGAAHRKPGCVEPPDKGRAPQLRTGPISELGGRTTVGYSYGRSDVVLTVYGGKAEAPVRATDLLVVADDPRFLELVREADARPLETVEPPRDAGFARLVGPGGPDHPDGQRAR